MGRREPLRRADGQCHRARTGRRHGVLPRLAARRTAFGRRAESGRVKKLRWALIAPIAACIILALAWHRSLGWLLLTIVAAALIAAVFAAVHHAEVVAHRVGEPFGTLILALAITIIEVALIVSMMLSGGAGARELARDTLFATVMIVCNGVVGLCLLAGSGRHHVLEFRVEGTSPALAVLIALTAMTLVLPSLTLTKPGPEYSTPPLVFAGLL